jgi:hypothetical protein
MSSLVPAVPVHFDAPQATQERRNPQPRSQSGQAAGRTIGALQHLPVMSQSTALRAKDGITLHASRQTSLPTGEAITKYNAQQAAVEQRDALATVLHSC